MSTNNHQCEEIGVFLSATTNLVRFRCIDTFNCDKVFTEPKAREFVINKYGKDKWDELDSICNNLRKDIQKSLYNNTTFIGGTPVGFDLKRFG